MSLIFNSNLYHSLPGCVYTWVGSFNIPSQHKLILHDAGTQFDLVLNTTSDNHYTAVSAFVLPSQSYATEIKPITYEKA
jgi:hypothetical protein